MLTQEYLKSIIHYDPLTGEFIWLKRNNKKSWNTRYANTKAGCHSWNGYINICIKTNKKIKYKAHKLAWLYVYGYIPEFPKYEIDHINNIRDDNRINNLRIGNKSINNQNIKHCKSHNKSGFLGVSLRKGVKPNKPYVSRININGNIICLGQFKTPTEAHEAYLKAKRDHHQGCTI